jgi:alkylated DNA repair dioxygenase AlkB
MIEGTFLIPNFVINPDVLFHTILNSTLWDERMQTRKTASFGVAYNYAPMSYPFQEMLPDIAVLSEKIYAHTKFTPNNCLINLYSDGDSKMGYHSDQIDILVPNTGVAILSLGEVRTLRFRKISNKEEKTALDLPSGSLFYMSQAVQKIWQHAIPKKKTEKARMSLTFRKISS